MKYVSFEIAQWLKEKGYAYLSDNAYIDKSGFYKDVGEFVNVTQAMLNGVSIHALAFAPEIIDLHQLFIDEFGLCIFVYSKDNKFSFNITDVNAEHKVKYDNEYTFDTYEKALIEGIKKTIEYTNYE